MKNYTGPIQKLVGQLSTPIAYSLPIGESNIHLNPLLGENISLRFNGEIYCTRCNRKTSKSFQQGYCYPCYRKLLDCNLCIIYPEKCNYSHKKCPDTWEHAQCGKEHIVYLANSSGLKVGITRLSQVPTRWIDQGASQAIPVLKVSNRYHSGAIEVMFKEYVQDKTNWRTMLKGDIQYIDMLTAKNNLLQQASEMLSQADHISDIQLLEEESITLEYPILNPPTELKTLSFDKESHIQGVLLGIKGQYLILDKGVLNMRKHSGYSLSFEY